ncbi:MAG: hypothetical protein IBX55_00510 [Methyloprofundus sp.]|nr:hypothetical protein [Methyloprofundus sp.]
MSSISDNQSVMNSIDQDIESLYSKAMTDYWSNQEVSSIVRDDLALVFKKLDAHDIRSDDHQSLKEDSVNKAYAIIASLHLSGHLEEEDDEHGLIIGCFRHRYLSSVDRNLEAFYSYNGENQVDDSEKLDINELMEAIDEVSNINIYEFYANATGVDEFDLMLYEYLQDSIEFDRFLIESLPDNYSAEAATMDIEYENYPYLSISPFKLDDNSISSKLERALSNHTKGRYPRDISILNDAVNLNALANQAFSQFMENNPILGSYNVSEIESNYKGKLEEYLENQFNSDLDFLMAGDIQEGLSYDLEYLEEELKKIGISSPRAIAPRVEVSELSGGKMKVDLDLLSNVEFDIDQLGNPYEEIDTSMIDVEDVIKVIAFSKLTENFYTGLSEDITSSALSYLNDGFPSVFSEVMNDVISEISDMTDIDVNLINFSCECRSNFNEIEDKFGLRLKLTELRDEWMNKSESICGKAIQYAIKQVTPHEFEKFYEKKLIPSGLEKALSYHLGEDLLIHRREDDICNPALAAIARQSSSPSIFKDLAKLEPRIYAQLIEKHRDNIEFIKEIIPYAYREIISSSCIGRPRDIEDAKGKYQRFIEKYGFDVFSAITDEIEEKGFPFLTEFKNVWLDLAEQGKLEDYKSNLKDDLSISLKEELV